MHNTHSLLHSPEDPFAAEMQQYQRRQRSSRCCTSSRSCIHPYTHNLRPSHCCTAPGMPSLLN
mgnify:CR=1 FL=1